MTEVMCATLHLQIKMFKEEQGEVPGAPFDKEAFTAWRTEQLASSPGFNAANFVLFEIAEKLCLYRAAVRRRDMVQAMRCCAYFACLFQQRGNHKYAKILEAFLLQLERSPAQFASIDLDFFAFGKDGHCQGADALLEENIRRLKRLFSHGVSARMERAGAIFSVMGDITASFWASVHRTHSKHNRTALPDAAPRIIPCIGSTVRALADLIDETGIFSAATEAISLDGSNVDLDAVCNIVSRGMEARSALREAMLKKRESWKGFL